MVGGSDIFHMVWGFWLDMVWGFSVLISPGVWLQAYAALLVEALAPPSGALPLAVQLLGSDIISDLFLIYYTRA